MFAGWSGSLRYKILFANSQINPVRLTVAHDPEFYVNTPQWVSESAENLSFSCGLYAIKVANLTNEHGVEIEVPYSSPYHFLPLRPALSAVNPEDFTNGCLVLTFSVPIVTAFADNFEVAIYIAAGDDFNFHFPIPFYQRPV